VISFGNGSSKTIRQDRHKLSASFWRNRARRHQFEIQTERIRDGDVGVPCLEALPVDPALKQKLMFARFNSNSRSLLDRDNLL
jgi:hypothetical protein